MRSFAVVLMLIAGCVPESNPTQPASPKTIETEREVEHRRNQHAGTLEPLKVPEGTPRAVVRRYNYTIEFGPYALEIDPVDGGRIIGFSLDGRSAVLPREESPEAYGSTFWPSPQSDWGWPPPIEWDKGVWRPEIEGSSLVLTSRINAKLSLSVTQRISAELDYGSIKIEYTLTNHGTSPRKVAPWQNTRVRPAGLTFYPSPDPTLPQSTLKLAPADGIVWFKHDPLTMKQSVKAFGDGREGWLGHVDGELLFVKIFPEIPREAQAPGEAEIEIYAHDTGEFVEMEQQGAYTELKPGESSLWPVRWLVRKLPKGIVAEPGNLAVVEYVRSLVAALSQAHAAESTE